MNRKITGWMLVRSSGGSFRPLEWFEFDDDFCGTRDARGRQFAVSTNDPFLLPN